MTVNAVYPIVAGAPLPAGGVEEVGNKAWNLLRMTAAGLPVPPAFVLPAGWCRRACAAPGEERALTEALSFGIGVLEKVTGLKFGSARRPLLVSVRSGAAVSMPGMMETVLNIGLNRETVEGLICLTGNPRLAWDSYRRLVQNYGEVVQQLPAARFEELLGRALLSAEAESERELDFSTLRRLTRDMLECYAQLGGEPFPQDALQQLRRAAEMVFRSWYGPKAAAYRKLNHLADDAGTAVTVQSMVFGNAGGASGSGVGFTRNPAKGDRELYLDFEFNGQGEDVVAGRRIASDPQRLRRMLPAVWAQLEETGCTLEKLFRDAQDFEFTVQAGMLYLLQSRSAGRTPWAALRIAVQLVEEGLISPEEAVSRLSGIDTGSLVRTRLADASACPLARAEAAAMGIASGSIALDSEAAQRLSRGGTPVILVRRGAETGDIDGLACAAGILTASGGRTSHAAVVARQLAIVCLTGCPDLEIDLARRTCRIGGRTMTEGEILSLDGNEGGIYRGTLSVVTERPERELAAMAEWSRHVSPLTL